MGTCHRFREESGSERVARLVLHAVLWYCRWVREEGWESAHCVGDTKRQMGEEAAWVICKCLQFQGNVQGECTLHRIQTDRQTGRIPILPCLLWYLPNLWTVRSTVVKKRKFRGEFYGSLEGSGLAC